MATGKLKMKYKTQK